jgi:hypothetical protein
MANFVIRLVQDLGHEADITDEIAGVPIHFNGIYEQGGWPQTSGKNENQP